MSGSLTDLAGLSVTAEDFLAGVLETVAQAVWVVDHDGVIRFANPAAITALGYERADELLGRHSHQTIHYRHPDGTPYPAAECPMLLPRTTGERVASDLDWFFRRDGSMFPVSYISVPLEMRDGLGAVVAFTDIEDRIAADRVLREHEAALEGQQASLRRVATLVSAGAASADVFAAVAEEVGHVTGLPLVAVWRYGYDGTATVLGAASERPHPFQAGTRWPLDGPAVCTRVLETGRTARIDDFADIPGTAGEAARATGIRACAGAPIVVDGAVWGVMSADSTDDQPLPDRIEDLLGEFTGLVATAISNAASRQELARLADEQAALRRMATLVARGVAPAEVFATVVREVGQLLDVSAAHMGRYDGDGTVTAVSSWSRDGRQMPLGTSSPADDTNVSSLVFATGRPARKDRYDEATDHVAALVRELGVRSSVAAPIVVDGSLWGVMIATSNEDQPIAADTESRMAAFTELVATAISNTEAKTETARLADEQAALRRVATLVAQAVPPTELFGAVAAEVGMLLGTDFAGMVRYEADETVTPLATWAAVGEHPEVPDRWPLEDGDPAAMIAQTRGPARIDDWGPVPGPLAAFARDELGLSSSVGSPILVDGRLWGALAVHSKQAGPLPSNAESRLLHFTELVGTAVANAQARSEVAASRARIVAAADEERRQVVRDLHDGAQQRLVHSIITLKLANRALEGNEQRAPELVSEALEHAERANVELRELAHGILPAVLTRGGLLSAVEALASRMPVPVEISVAVDRLPAPVEATAYFVVAEALTNVAKHAHATGAAVRAHVEADRLQLEVRDDGVGGARRQGTGLVGLADRLAALDGNLRVESPVDGGTLIAAEMPVLG